jgi:septum formation topological specificity factor MinE
MHYWKSKPPLPVKPVLISETLMNQLRERLSQEWLTQECQVVVAYKTVHKIVPYKLNAKLKVPRPRSAKAKPEVQATLKKKLPEIISVLLRYLEVNKSGTGVKITVTIDSKPATAPTITLKGVKPEGMVSWSRKNFELYGVVEPATGERILLEVLSP